MAIEVMQRVSFMVWDILNDEEEQMFITGIVILFDFTGYTLDHFTQMPLSMVKKLMPCWEVAFHYIVLKCCKILINYLLIDYYAIY